MSTTLELPDTMTPDLAEILGKPNFWCGPIAEAMRISGDNIPRKAEAEQAHVILWLLRLHAEHGSDWRKFASVALDQIIIRAKQKETTP